ncbi:MAG: hypothetical protein PHI97_00145 [Desulfobulbus sp.]|nr:hypothetical protein [Desulfobulbus sp.]
MRLRGFLVLFTSLFFFNLLEPANAELILGYEMVKGPTAGTATTPIEILLTGETSGKPLTGLTKSNFKFVIARDMNSGVVRAITWDIVPLSVPGAYRMKITPKGWAYYNYATMKGQCYGLNILFRVTSSSGADSGGLQLYTSPNTNMGY